MTFKLNPSLDLVLERIVDVSPETVWAAWTMPEHIVHWFTPAPWKTIDCEIDLRPGGIFRTTMQSPEGQEFPNMGCYLELVENQKLVWTNTLEPGFRPATLSTKTECESFAFTAIVTIEPHGNGSKYTATVLHNNEADCKKHDAMGFAEGWGKALEQLVEHMKAQGKA